MVTVTIGSPRVAGWDNHKGMPSRSPSARRRLRSAQVSSEPSARTTLMRFWSRNLPMRGDECFHRSVTALGKPSALLLPREERLGRYDVSR